MGKNAEKTAKNTMLCILHRIKTAKIGKKTKRGSTLKRLNLQNVYIFAI